MDAAELHDICVAQLDQLFRSLLAAVTAAAVYQDQLLFVRQLRDVLVTDGLVGNIDGAGDMCEYVILEDFNMDKYIYDNSNGLWYELQGDYYIPCLELPAEKEERHIGIWGHRHLRYIREHKKVL